MQNLVDKKRNGAFLFLIVTEVEFNLQNVLREMGGKNNSHRNPCFGVAPKRKKEECRERRNDAHMFKSPSPTFILFLNKVIRLTNEVPEEMGQDDFQDDHEEGGLSGVRLILSFSRSVGLFHFLSDGRAFLHERGEVFLI